MKELLTSAQMKAADLSEIERGTPSRTLMERAAKEALHVLREEFDTRCVLFLCGNGNNGGDGLAMARFFAEAGGNARVCYAGAWKANTPDTAQMSAEAAYQLSLLPKSCPVTPTLSLQDVSCVVDALFGIGLSRPIEGKMAAWIRKINSSGLPVLSVDIPSGVNADNGSIEGVAIRATRTVTMAAYKWGHLLYPGAMLCGRLSLSDIGIPIPPQDAHMLEKSDLNLLPPRSPRAHKGSFGRVLIIGGSVGMSGAGYLSAKAAYRSGAGLVEIFAPEANRIIYQTQLPEALLTLYDPDHFDTDLLRSALQRADAVAIGMGLGATPLTQLMLEEVLRQARCPIIADADALNVTATSPALALLFQSRNAPVILTPHMGEAARLLHTSVPALSADPKQAVQHLAQAYRAIAVLKDARTLICDGEHLTLNPFGNNGMATGGSGDVLAGIIAAIAASGASPHDAARLGVLIHALAGDAALSSRGSHAMMASDLIEGLCHVLT